MSTRERVRIPANDCPRVSVLMVTYGARDWVEASIAALASNTEPVYELIVVDNGSDDGTREFLRDAVEGAILHEADTNLGFGAGNNLAELHARGEFLCLLNSDAIVPTGWLAPLLARFDDPRVAAVTPLYVYPDGRVQEAGAIVESDGRAVALGVGGDPESLAWRWRRSISYGSAACMLVRRLCFEAVGGFDPAYGLAYYEDVDFAFRLRARGWRVVLEPAVRVVHAQGGSSSEHSEAVAARDANQALFRSRWEHELWYRPVIFGQPQPHRAAAARDIDAVDRVLLVVDDLTTDWEAVPQLARAIAEELDSGVVTVLATRAATTGVDDLLDNGIEVEVTETREEWLEERRFHYSAIVTIDAPSAAISEALRACQPQASIVAAPSDATIHDRTALGRWLLDVGLVPRAEYRLPR